MPSFRIIPMDTQGGYTPPVNTPGELRPANNQLQVTPWVSYTPIQLHSLPITPPTSYTPSNYTPYFLHSLQI